LHGTDTLKGTDKSLKPMSGFSCGLLVREDKMSITIATDYWGNDEWRNCETIYKKQIDNFQIKETK
jgi:aldehyde:ferredoxin oxidoreductase